MWIPATTKEKKQSLKALLKKVELEYKTTVKDADKKCAALRRDAELQAERERADTKARKDLADKIAKEEYAQTKAEAAKIHIQTVLDIVRDAILDIKDRNLQQPQQQPFVPDTKSSFSSLGDVKRSPSSSHSSSCAPKSSFPTSSSTFQYPPQGSYSNQYYGYTNSSSNSSSSILSTGGNAKDDAEIREWVEYAADKLEAHMSRAQARQRILEEVAGAALVREQAAQQEAAQRTLELEAEVRQLRLLQEQVLLQQQMGQLQLGGQMQGGFGGEGGEVAPPAYLAEEKKDGEKDHKF
ncbi:hypothetical protein BGZ93_008664 [Podila epicladia]|nr:hypothetical protein BGZ92_007108 [Podila epicladia]KAG0091817.1 hypothetical protein BGZ93_008664 [Podila epicladia]